jgi:hypothetical protein
MKYHYHDITQSAEEIAHQKSQPLSDYDPE